MTERDQSESAKRMFEATFEVRVLFDDPGAVIDRDQVTRRFLSYFIGVHDDAPLQQMWEAGHEELIGITGRLASLCIVERSGEVVA